MIFKLSNYNKPSHKTFKLIADICIYAIPVYIPIINSFPLSDNTKLWIVNGLTILSATIKLISKFTTDSNYVDNTSETINKDSK